jgi:hypothetical protein
MAEEIQNITQNSKFNHITKKFNKVVNATVKKGELFEMYYFSNFEDSQTLEVTSGTATDVKDVPNKDKGEFDYYEYKRTYRADQADADGNIVISITEQHRATVQMGQTYKIKVV